ncbi:enterobactin ABC transporter permease [Cryobacterium melibiosiphilum]|uniref:Enterobactin ABC transporter permease n=1 Tax=Cryobacterium melibiosiphilum TaxID=995039 RepID=A0A3A5MP24_9MICO|nr:iron chelate uptake ABC transporter family permease subunit [Cryobacterium melibiosiphilum]RJT88898.1 enterobactin ABC transporter permease [Cryobacterium melibiosiphilum]
MRRIAWILIPLLVITVVAFFTVGAQGDWSFVLPFRGRRLAALVLVGFAIAVSTVIFQTITENRILTPSILGFDALFALIQTVLVFVVGSSALGSIPPVAQFAGEVVLMVVLSTLLFRWLFGGARRSIHLLVLVGIVCGVFFRSIASFMARLIDPNEFTVLQDRLFASFNAVEPDLLLISAVLLAAASVLLWRMRHDLDVLTLGRDLSTVLGVDHRHLVLRLLIIVSVLVSVSTALVGPITFFGLLVASLAYQVTGSHRHSANLPVAVALAVVALVGGQTVLEHVFGLATVLSVIIEFIGGIVFILLVLKGARR